MNTSAKVMIRFPVLAILVLSLFAMSAYGVVLANEHEESGSSMNMDGGSAMDAMDTGESSTMDGMNMDEGSAMDSTDMGESSTMTDMNMSEDTSMSGMDMGSRSSWQDLVNKVSYPLTAVVALFTVWVCVMLTKATGLIDKFGLVSAGLLLFLVQSIFGVVYYVSDGSMVTMPTLMFIMSVFNSIALLLIGAAFYRWKRMLSSMG